MKQKVLISCLVASIILNVIFLYSSIQESRSDTQHMAQMSEQVSFFTFRFAELNLSFIDRYFDEDTHYDDIDDVISDLKSINTTWYPLNHRDIDRTLLEEIRRYDSLQYQFITRNLSNNPSEGKLQEFREALQVVVEPYQNGELETVNDYIQALEKTNQRLEEL
ncbi:hypothetical protein BKP35_17290 [Anaerobacillus arseniciselenatis]|uniref:Uncharacterized protein n=1 Tax=Anaerobacillus arseniciselenatis TaxID=85682 RepID=A0A1S2LAT6_9BACI|nr:hypothetical protein [Anaerobacillus arseniciselenatis]OIJ09153.1 hypothetical protein BKP35_17290 [Anaerobacillus arseniciselenatis]